MEVRNVTGRKQTDSSSGIVLQPMPPGEYMDVPYDVALRLWRARILEIRRPEDMKDHLWKESDGTHVFWASPFSLGDGYGTAAETMVLALKRQGLKIHIAACWFVSTYGLRQKTVDMLQDAHPGPMKVGICMATAGEFHKLPTPYKIGFTMYESDNPLENLPEWRHDCRCLDMLLVPSEHSKRIFARFVEQPIKVIPLAVNPIYRTSKRKRVTRRPFTFGMHGTLTGRKAPLELIEAFKKAFPTEKDVRLRLKTRLGICGYNQGMLPQITDSRIKVIDANWLLPRMQGWLEKQVDCYVFPSKGEGFGMPPREAMATGCPLIVSNHTGLIDICNEKYNWPIPVAKTEQSPLGGIWRIPDWDYVIETMRYIYHHREEAYAKAHEGSRWYVDNFGADASARRMIDVIEAIDPDAVQNNTVVPAETIDNNAGELHHIFYEQLDRFIEGPVLDIGVGEGVLYAELTKRGYEVHGVVEPKKYDYVAQKLQQAGLPVRLYPRPLWEADQLGLEVNSCVSQNTLHYYTMHELERILVSAMKVSPTVLFSVPTVHYPGDFDEGAKLMRRARWQDMLEDFDFEMHYYGARHYIWVRLIKFDAGSRATAVKQSRRKGMMIDGTWHPLPWERADGEIVRGEQI